MSSSTRPERYDWRTGDVLTGQHTDIVVLGISRWQIEFAPIFGDPGDGRYSLGDSQKNNAGLFDRDFVRRFTRTELYGRTHAHLNALAPWDRLPKKGEVYFLQEDLDLEETEVDLSQPLDAILEAHDELCPHIVLCRKGDIVMSMQMAEVLDDLHRDWARIQTRAGAPWECHHVLQFMDEFAPTAIQDPTSKAKITGWQPTYPVDDLVAANRQEMRRMQAFIDNHTE